MFFLSLDFFSSSITFFPAFLENAFHSCTLCACATASALCKLPVERRDRGPTGGERERTERTVGVSCKSRFRREKQDGWAEGRTERARDSEGIFSTPASHLSRPLPFSSCEGQAWRGCGPAQRLCAAPRGASHRNPINHWSRSLTPGHKDPTRRLSLHTLANKQTSRMLMHACKGAAGEC